MRSKEQKIKDSIVLNCCKAASIFILAAYSFFGNFLLSNVGIIFPIVALSFMLMPRKLINIFLDEDN